MMVAFYNGVAGIKTQSVGIDVSSNNVSNINTVGFKGSQAEFKDVFYQNINTAGFSPDYSQLGLASTMAATALNVREGSLESTDSMLDLAISGDGWFRIADGSGDVYYTRSGTFHKDVTNSIVNDAGYYLMGTMANFNESKYSKTALEKLGLSADENALSVKAGTDLAFSDVSEPIKLPNNLYMPLEPTTKVSFKGNLSSNTEYELKQTQLNMDGVEKNIENNLLSFSANINNTPGITSFHPDDKVDITISDANGNSLKTKASLNADGSFGVENFDISTLDSTTLSLSAISVAQHEKPSTATLSTDLYSPNGSNNLLTINLSKTSKDATGSIWNAIATITDKDGKEISNSQGQIRFDSNGALISSTLTNINNEGVNVGLDFGKDYDGLSVRDGASVVENITKDGYGEGLLKEYAINEDGTVVALFDNGKQAAVAKIPIFHFQNDQGLFSVGGSGTLFAQTSNSGEAFMYAKEDGTPYNGSKLKNYFLEMSNVDFGTEMTNIIVMQKAYEASARSITTSDEMLQKAINMKLN